MKKSEKMKEMQEEINALQCHNEKHENKITFLDRCLTRKERELEGLEKENKFLTIAAIFSIILLGILTMIFVK